jgi:hypothetical protein
MRPVTSTRASILRTADSGAPLYEGSDTGQVYSTRHRAFAYTALITVLTVFALAIGGTIDSIFTIMLYVHLATLFILLIIFAIVAATRYRPGEGALLTITLLDALALAFYGYQMTLHFFTLVTGVWLIAVACIVAFGCVLVIVLGFAVLAR